MTRQKTVRFEVANDIATITLDRPTALNAMNDNLMIDLNDALQRVVDDPSVRVVVLTGEGRGFCSGADLTVAAEGNEGEDGPTVISGDATADGMDKVFHPPIRALAELPVPTICRLNGVAAGGGMGLALGCDIVIAARSARFVSTFGPRLGIVPDLGTTYQLPHLVGFARARGIAMLGGSISAEQAAEWGLIWMAVDDGDLDRAVAETAAQLAKSSPEAMVRIRSALTGAETASLDEQLDVEREHQRILIPKNMGEGATAFVEKRDPHFDNIRRQR